jgi:RNA polymerase sigma-70 factor (ECF subfamily)
VSATDRAQRRPGPTSKDIFDARELADLYRSEAPRLARYFRRRLCTDNDTYDWVQESFLRFALAQTVERMRNPRAYLQRIARNLLVDSWRKAATLDIHRVELGSVELVVGPEQGHAIEADDLMQQYRRAVSELSSKTRVVFLLHRVEELTYNEIATRLEISINTVEYHMGRALLQLDRALNHG